MIQLERPDWQQVMAYVTAIYKHFETWKTEGPLAAHLVSIWCCIQILFITSYFSSYSCKQEQRLEMFQIWVGEFLLPLFPTACVWRQSEKHINMTTIQRCETSYSCCVVLDSCVIPSQEVVHQTEMWLKSNLLHDFSWQSKPQRLSHCPSAFLSCPFHCWVACVLCI